MTELPIDVFGDDASVEPLLVHDTEVMLGTVTAGTGRWVVVAVDDVDGGAWLYLTVPIGPEVPDEALLEPDRLRSLLTDPNADVRELIGFPSGPIWEPAHRPIPDTRLPGTAATP